MCPSESENLGLGGRELLIREHTLRVKLRQLLELRTVVILWFRWRRLLLLRVLLLLLLIPPLGLTARDPVGHGSGGSGNDGGARCHT